MQDQRLPASTLRHCVACSVCQTCRSSSDPRLHQRGPDCWPVHCQHGYPCRNVLQHYMYNSLVKRDRFPSWSRPLTVAPRDQALWACAGGSVDRGGRTGPGRREGSMGAHAHGRGEARRCTAGHRPPQESSAGILTLQRGLLACVFWWQAVRSCWAIASRMLV